MYYILTGTQLFENILIKSGKKNGINAISCYISQSQQLDLTSKTVNSEEIRLCFILMLGHTRATHSFLFDREIHRP